MCCVLFLVKNMLCSVFSEEYVAFQTVVASLLKNFNQTGLNFWAIFHDTFSFRKSCPVNFKVSLAAVLVFEKIAISQPLSRKKRAEYSCNHSCH